ncbi:hypothetical protein ABT026_11255 [Streptomyces sp. NPDC002734]|uniref:hypothetical protein n=1 Tax=Streptomyces sp. NPDC002734 TaxID=3154426 RepID=UPI00331D542A
MTENCDHGDDLLRAGDYMTGADDAPVIPSIMGFPRQRLSDVPADVRVVRQRGTEGE